MTEQPIAFGPEGGLVGTLCLPERRGASALGFILFNAGVVHRVGPHRINVRFARRLAGRGLPSLRFDLSGLGDSQRPAGARPFEEQAIADLRAAMDCLQARAGATRFILFGFCSGAYQSYATALVDERVAGVVLFDAYQYPTLRARLNVYRLRLRERGVVAALAGWSGSLARKLAGAFRSATGQAPRASDVRFSLRLPPKAELAQGLKTLDRRGVSVCVIHTGGGFWHCNYEGQFDDAFRQFRLPARVSAAFFPDLDHVLTSMEGQTQVMQKIEDWVTRSFEEVPSGRSA